MRRRPGSRERPGSRRSIVARRPAVSPPDHHRSRASPIVRRPPSRSVSLTRAPSPPSSSPPFPPHRLLGDAPHSPSPALLALLVPALLPAILRGVHDPVEKVRETCAELVLALVERLDDCAPTLKHLAPAVTARVGTGTGTGTAPGGGRQGGGGGAVDPLEPSEEIRLALVEALALSARKTRDSRDLAPFLEDVASVLAVAAADPFHDVKKAAFAAVVALVNTLVERHHDRETVARRVALAALAPSVARLSRAIVPECAHRHSAVRAAALRALDALFDAASDAVVREIVAPGVAPMCYDRTPAVRAEFHAALERWMRVENRSAEEEENSGEKTVAARSNAAAPEDPSSPEDPMDHDDPMALSAASSRLPPGCALPHAPVFLPMLLTGVADEAEGNAARALALVEAVGEENAARLRDGRSRRKKTQSESAGEGDDDPDEASSPSSPSSFALSALPPPFSSDGAPPSLPSRRLVRAILPSLIRRSCAEAREWTASRRNAGAKLLATVCAFAGAAASDHLDEIFAACHSAVQDEDADTAARVLGAARCVGAHCPGEQWLPFSLDAICAEERGKGKHTSDANRAAALCVLAAALRGVKPGTLGARSAEVLFAGGGSGGGGGGGGGSEGAEGSLSRRTTPRGARGDAATAAVDRHAGVRAQTLAAVANAIRAGARGVPGEEGYNSGAKGSDSGVKGCSDSGAKDSDAARRVSATAGAFRVLPQLRAAEGGGLGEGEGGASGSAASAGSFQTTKTADGAALPPAASSAAFAVVAALAETAFGDEPNGGFSGDPPEESKEGAFSSTKSDGPRDGGVSSAAASEREEKISGGSKPPPPSLLDPLSLLYRDFGAMVLAESRAESRAWTGECPGQRAFAALLLDAPAHACASLIPLSAPAFREAGKRDKPAELRTAMLRIADACFERAGLEEKETAAIGGAGNNALRLAWGGAEASRAVLDLTKESLVWRAGKTEANARYAAAVAFGTYARTRCLTKKALRGELRGVVFSAGGEARGSTNGGSAFSFDKAPGPSGGGGVCGEEGDGKDAANETSASATDGELLPGLASAMEEDYFADTRAAACHAVAEALRLDAEYVVGKNGDEDRGGKAASSSAFDDARRRFLYPELLKRMDDSRDAIRVTAADAVGAFFDAMPRDYDETNVGYLLKGFFVHMDDPNPEVREAVCVALEKHAAKKKPEATRDAAKNAGDTHREKGFVERVVRACEEEVRARILRGGQ